MKRDLVLIRELMLYVEEGTFEFCAVRDAEVLQTEPRFEKWTPNEIGYHIWLLVDAGYANGAIVRVGAGEHSMNILHELTYKGHEFLDSIRNEGIFAGIKDYAKKHGSELPMTMIQALGIKLIEKSVGI